MKGHDVYKKVCTLLGYSDFQGDFYNRKSQAVTGMINQIADDLKIGDIHRLSEEINAGVKQSEALIYGTAMLLALSESDNEKANLFTNLYNAKRSAALCETTRREDVLPVNSDGGI